MTRFYEFKGGELLIDGRDIRTVDLAQHRRQQALDGVQGAVSVVAASGRLVL